MNPDLIYSHALAFMSWARDGGAELASRLRECRDAAETPEERAAFAAMADYAEGGGLGAPRLPDGARGAPPFGERILCRWGAAYALAVRELDEDDDGASCAGSDDPPTFVLQDESGAVVDMMPDEWWHLPG